MDWVERLNEAVRYIEENLTGEIEYEKLGQIACCSAYHFQRMFAYIAGMPLSVYIRRRKMSLAAVDLQGGGAKIIDVAAKYGYASPTAFNRAFQSVHGVNPSSFATGTRRALRGLARQSRGMAPPGAPVPQNRTTRAFCGELRGLSWSRKGRRPAKQTRLTIMVSLVIT